MYCAPPHRENLLYWNDLRPVNVEYWPMQKRQYFNGFSCLIGSNFSTNSLIRMRFAASHRGPPCALFGITASLWLLNFKLDETRYANVIWTLWCKNHIIACFVKMRKSVQSFIFEIFEYFFFYICNINMKFAVQYHITILHAHQLTFSCSDPYYANYMQISYVVFA